MSMTILNPDELLRITGGGAVTIPCQGNLPAPQTFLGDKGQQIKAAASAYAMSPGFSLAEESKYLTSRTPGTTQDHVNYLCSTPSGRQYLANDKAIFDKAQ